MFDSPLRLDVGPLRCVVCRHRHGAPAQDDALPWLATELNAPALQMARDTFGRPRLPATLPGFDASWSHSGDGLLVALGQGVQVGADLERLRPRPRALELAQRFFAPEETRWLAAQPPAARELAFVRLWCAKEAVLKAHGRGIAFGLHRFVIGERDGRLALLAAAPELGAVADWTLHEFAPSPDYRAALAWRPLPADSGNA